MLPAEIADFVRPGNPFRLRLRGSEWIVHHLGPLLFGAVTLLLLYLEYLNPPNGWTLPSYLSGIAFLLTLVVLYRRRRKLTFIAVASPRSATEAWQVIADAAGVAGWKVAAGEPGRFLRIRTALADDGVNTGELITILFDDGVVRINSINDPSDWSYLYSGSANKEHAQWLETTLEQGVWKYDPEEAENRSVYSSPASTSLVLDYLSAGVPPRFYPFRKGSPGREMLEYLLFLLLFTGFKWFEKLGEYSGSEAIIYGIIGFLLNVAPLAISILLVRLYSTFKEVRTDRSDGENFRRVRQALVQTGWHINYEDEAKGIEARLPHSTPEDGNIGVFVFRNGCVYVNLFDSVDNPLPSFRRSTRTTVIKWIHEVLQKEERVEWTIDSASIPSDPFTAKEVGIEMEQPIYKAYVVKPGNPPRLRLHGKRWKRLFDRPLWIMGVTLVFCVLLQFSPVQSGGDGQFIPQLLSLALFLIAAVLFAVRYHRLRFTVIQTDKNAAANYERVLAVCKEEEWTLLRESPNLFIEAYRRSKAAPEEMITIFFDGGDVYVNSINKLEESRPIYLNSSDLGPATYSAERNRENVERVVRGLTESR